VVCIDFVSGPTLSAPWQDGLLNLYLQPEQMPQWTRFWSAMLADLPVVGEVLLAYHAGLYRLTSRVPKEWHRNKPQFH
jgi:hypothetical protein